MLYTELFKKRINAYGFKVIEYKKFARDNGNDEHNLAMNISGMIITNALKAIKVPILRVYNALRDIFINAKEWLVNMKNKVTKKFLKVKSPSYHWNSVKSNFGSNIVRLVTIRCRSNC
ncbi:hypothetical protein [Anaerosporobacter sp.]